MLPKHYLAKSLIYGDSKINPSERQIERSLENMGIRDFEAVDKLALNAGLRLLEDRAMPANNRCIVWQRREAG